MYCQIMDGEGRCIIILEKKSWIFLLHYFHKASTMFAGGWLFVVPASGLQRCPSLLHDPLHTSQSSSRQGKLGGRSTQLLMKELPLDPAQSSLGEAKSGQITLFSLLQSHDLLHLKENSTNYIWKPKVTCSGVNLTIAERTLTRMRGWRPHMYWNRMFRRYSNSGYSSSLAWNSQVGNLSVWYLV